MQGVVLHIVKHLKIGIHEIAAVAIITFATLLRVLVTALGWPRTNSDEDTIGIMGLHIAYHGDHPIFFYGQNYMGATEAYIGAGLFHIFGLFLGIAFLLGTINIFSEIPSAQTANQQQDALVTLRAG